MLWEWVVDVGLLASEICINEILNPQPKPHVLQHLDQVACIIGKLLCGRKKAWIKTPKSWANAGGEPTAAAGPGAGLLLGASGSMLTCALGLGGGLRLDRGDSTLWIPVLLHVWVRPRQSSRKMLFRSPNFSESCFVCSSNLDL